MGLSAHQSALSDRRTRRIPGAGLITPFNSPPPASDYRPRRPPTATTRGPPPASCRSPRSESGRWWRDPAPRSGPDRRRTQRQAGCRSGSDVAHSHGCADLRTVGVPRRWRSGRAPPRGRWKSAAFTARRPDRDWYALCTASCGCRCLVRPRRGVHDTAPVARSVRIAPARHRDCRRTTRRRPGPTVLDGGEPGGSAAVVPGRPGWDARHPDRRLRRQCQPHWRPLALRLRTRTKPVQRRRRGHLPLGMAAKRGDVPLSGIPDLTVPVETSNGIFLLHGRVRAARSAGGGPGATLVDGLVGFNYLITTTSVHADTSCSGSSCDSDDTDSITNLDDLVLSAGGGGGVRRDRVRPGPTSGPARSIRAVSLRARPGWPRAGFPSRAPYNPLARRSRTDMLLSVRPEWRLAGDRQRACYDRSYLMSDGRTPGASPGAGLITPVLVTASLIATIVFRSWPDPRFSCQHTPGYWPR